MSVSECQKSSDGLERGPDAVAPRPTVPVREQKTNTFLVGTRSSVCTGVAAFLFLRVVRIFLFSLRLRDNVVVLAFWRLNMLTSVALIGWWEKQHSNSQLMD